MCVRKTDFSPNPISKRILWIWFGFSAYRKNEAYPIFAFNSFMVDLFCDALDRRRQSDIVASFLNTHRWLYWFSWNIMAYCEYNIVASSTLDFVLSALIENTSKYGWWLAYFARLFIFHKALSHSIFGQMEKKEHIILLSRTAQRQKDNTIKKMHCGWHVRNVPICLDSWAYVPCIWIDFFLFGLVIQPNSTVHFCLDESL